jgi:hypothetical protein
MRPRNLQRPLPMATCARPETAIGVRLALLTLRSLSPAGGTWTLASASSWRFGIRLVCRTLGWWFVAYAGISGCSDNPIVHLTSIHQEFMPRSVFEVSTIQNTIVQRYLER